MWIYFNPNPKGKMTTDCVIRMLCKIFDLTWQEAYLELSKVVLAEYEMPSSNYIWEKYLESKGFKKEVVGNCCLSVSDFAFTKDSGVYIACTGTHVVAIEHGCYFDAWDSGSEIVSYYFYI